MHCQTTAKITATEITRMGYFYKLIHMFGSIDLCILQDAYHDLFCIFGDSSASGTQDAGVTKSLRIWEYGPQPW